jgi:hypothetical protein
MTLKGKEEKKKLKYEENKTAKKEDNCYLGNASVTVTEAVLKPPFQ